VESEFGKRKERHDISSLTYFVSQSIYTDLAYFEKLEAQHWAEPVSLTLHSALKKLNTEHSIAYRCFTQASTLTFFLTCPFGQLTKTSCKSKSFGLVLYSAIKKTSGMGWGWPHASTLGAFHLSIHPDHKYIWLRAWAIRHLICLVTLIINIYCLGWVSRSHLFIQIHFNCIILK
jgi:hypothetical protein